MQKEDHAKIVNINSRHHNILSFDSGNIDKSRDLGKSLSKDLSENNFAH